MKRIYCYRFIIIFYLLFVGCAKESDTYKPISKVILTVKDDNGNNVSGARVSVYSKIEDYENAFSTKNFGSNEFFQNGSFTNQNGVVEITFTEPDREYWMLITYRDNGRQLDLSNYGTIGNDQSGHIKKLPKRSEVKLEVVITPINGNLIFYSTAVNKVPIEIRVARYKSQTGLSIHTLSGIYTGSGIPAIGTLANLSVTRDPGLYTYYAKSADGCVWAGNVNLTKGQVSAIDLSKCNAGSLYFHTPALNAAKLPISVTLNNIDSLGTITSTRDILTCTDADINAPSGTLKVFRNKGLYTYFARTADGKCVWTGSINIVADQCLIVPLLQCDN